MCALCCDNVVCRTSSVRRHFESKHEKAFKEEADKVEKIMKAVIRYEKQASVLKKMSCSKNQATEGSYIVAQCIAKH